jgi:hypothetical protein
MQLELALASDDPVDTELSDRFFASAEATLAVLKELERAPEEQALAWGAAREERGQRIRELETLLEAGNTRALNHLPWLEGWVAAEAPRGARELLRQIETLDFPAALETLRGLGEGVFADPR